MRFGLDYAWTTIGPTAHKAVGSSFACRYLSPDHTKNLTLGEKQQLETGGIDIVTVWEAAATRALEGNPAGIADAKEALSQAEALSIPSDRPIYFGVDFDETPGQALAVQQYFQGVNSVLSVDRTGVYGGFWVVKRLFDAKVVKYGWQTYAWSGGQWDSRAQLQQFSNGHIVNGSSCDYNHAVADDFGQWEYKPPLPPPTVKWASSELQVSVPSGTTGTLGFAGTFATQTGAWTVHGTEGTDVRFSGPGGGEWRVRGIEWNAPPLGS